MGENMTKASQFQLPTIKQPPSLAFDPTTNKMFVNGVTFDADDAAKALETENLVSGPGTGLPQGGNWVALDQNAYGQYLNSIKNPSAGRLFKKNFGRGVDSLQMIGGAAIEGVGDLVGSESIKQFGDDIVFKQAAELNKTSPFQREFADIDSGATAVDWAIASLGQAAPSLIESVVTAVGGAAVGFATGGPGGAIGGGVLSVGAKEALKQQIKAAAVKKATQGWQALLPDEKLLLKRTAAATYATGASFASNYASGFGEAYLGTEEAGVANPYAALLAAAPYAALESLPEFLLFSRYMGNKLPAKIGPDGKARPVGALAGDRLKKGLSEGSLGIAAEGLTEAGQQFTTSGLAPLIAGGEMADDLGAQMLEAGAAGALTGGVVGGASGLLRGRQRSAPIPTDKPTNMLAIPPKNPPSGPAPASWEVMPPAPQAPQGGLPNPVTGAPQLPSPPSPVTAMGAPNFVVGPDGVVRAAMPEDVVVNVQGNVAPTQQSGSQGVLDIFGGQPLTAGELAARMQPQVTPQLGMTPQPPVANPAQGALQFAPPAPEAPVNTQMATQLQAIQDQQRRNAEFEQARIAQEQQKQQQMDALQRQGQIQRQLDMIAPQAAPVPPAQPPMVQGQARTPQQMQLFRRGELPRPSARERLQRGIPAPQATAVPSLPAPVDLRTSPQMSLFTQQGEPTVAALRSAGTRQPVAAPILQRGAKQIPPTGKAVTPAAIAKAKKEAEAKQAKTKAGVAKLKAKGAKDATQEGKQQQGRVEQRAQDNEGVRGGRQVGQQPKTEVKGGGAKASGGGKSVLSRKKQEEVTPPKPPTPPKGGKPAPKAPAKKTEAKAAPAPKAAALKKGTKAQAVVDEEPVVRKTVAELEAEAAAAKPKTVVEDLTDVQLLDDAIATAETTTDRVDFRLAMDTVMEFAYFDTDPNNRPLWAKALGFITTTQFSEAQRGIMDSAFLDGIVVKDKIYATYKGGKDNGKEKPWFEYAQMRNLLPSVNKLVKVEGLPKSYQTELKAETPKAMKTELPKTSPAEDAANKLADLIYNLRARIRRIEKLTSTAGKAIISTATELYKTARKDFRLTDGNLLSDYFKADGTPKMVKSGGVFVFTTKEVTAAEQAQIEKVQAEERKALAAENNALKMAEFERARMEKEGFKEEDTWDGDDGMFYRDNGEPINSTIPAGRVRLMVNAFLSKLKMKPNTYVFANQADLAAKDPALYKRAAAARKNGDFDSTKAVGYSFGDTVIIFSDRVRTEQQLKFVLAHETLGHYGFKGVMGRAELKAALERIYNADRNVQAEVDRMVEMGMEKLEAIEEYLADNAALLDVSLVARIWSALKNALNKLGFQFADDEARYLVGMARRYVREGNQGNFVSAKTLTARMEAQWRDQYDGRFSEEDMGRLNSRVINTASLNKRFGQSAGLAGFAERWADFTSKKKSWSTMLAEGLEKVQTLDNMARRSEGLEAIFKLFEERGQKARALLSKYSRMTGLTHAASFFGYGGGVTEQEKEQAGELLAHAALLRKGKLTEAQLDSFGSLVRRTASGAIVLDPIVRKQLEDTGFVTAEEFTKGFNITYSTGQTKFFQFKVDENSNVWKIYKENRAAVNEAAIDLMLANYEAAVSETNRVLNGLNDEKVIRNIFDKADLDAIRRVAAMYQNIRYENSSVANASVEIQRAADTKSDEFMKRFGTAVFGDAAFNDWVTGTGTAAEFKDMPFYDDAVDILKQLRTKNLSKEQSFAIQATIKNMFMFDLTSRNADIYAKRTLLGAYVPFSRRGEWQVRLAVYDEKGRAVSLDPTITDSLPYFQFENEADAAPAMEKLEEEFGNKQVWNLKDDLGQDIKVIIRPELSKTKVSPDLTEAVNFNEFVYVLNRLNANIAPDVREKIIRTLTAQNSSARNSLERSGTEGWDKDVIRSVSEHLETSAHVAAKKLYRHRFDDVMLNDDMWLGDSDKLDNLAKAVKNATTEGQRAAAQKAYDKYAYQYMYSAPQAKGSTVNVGGKEEATLGRGRTYQEEAKKLFRWYNENTNVNDSTEDLLSGEAGSLLKLVTVVMQLGGSIATAAVNMVSLVTHATPWLGTYNPKTAYGGGYGMANSSSALYRAISDLKNAKLADAAFLEKMLQDGTYDQFNLTRQEAEFLLAATEEGTLQAAQFNALVGTARGKVFNNKAQKAIEVWMSAFSYTEQLNRRTVALAAYRLEYARAIAQGLSAEQAAFNASEMARTAVNTTMGEYAMYNRPEMARGNVAQYIFMYKQFVIVSVQLLKNMDTRGQLLMLGMLLLMGGLKGLPFADDIFDLVDTIAQKLGLKMASVEKELAQFIDGVAPGLAPYVMRGVVDQFSGATFSSRVGMGDLIPLTGVFKAGADPAREAEQFVGPVFSGITGLVATAGSLASYGAESIGLKDDVTSGLSILRNSPVAALRAIGDGIAYTSDGKITNMQGKVIANNAPAHVILARFLGFYPAIATQQNDIVRMQKQSAEYAKAIKASYVNSYVQAKLDGDQAGMEKIRGYVEQWNKDAEGTGLEISKFVQSANRAAKEAARPTALRYLKSAPKGMREETRDLINIFGLTEDMATQLP
jgi:hypothetical protein